MNKLLQAYDFMEDFIRWGSIHADIRAAALVGSYARGEARKTSDVDLVIIVNQPGKYLTHTEWVETFGMVITKQIEDYGRLTSLRVWYESGLEIEFGFTTRAWVHSPLDAGTKRVIADGLRVLFEKEVLLSPYERVGSAST